MIAEEAREDLRVLREKAALIRAPFIIERALFSAFETILELENFDHT